jgi:hypothetical protein
MLSGAVLGLARSDLATSRMTSQALPLAAARPLRISVPVLAWLGVYALLLIAGNQLLRDPDTYWQIAVGNRIVDHRTVPTIDVYSWTMAGQPWISTQWLAQVALAASFNQFGWPGPVMLTAMAAAAAFGLLARALSRHLAPTIVLALLLAALSLTMQHLLARPHVLAMPVMVAFVGGLIAALDQRRAPSLLLLPLMTLWANMHGGFILGLALIAPLGIGAAWAVPAAARRSMLARWVVFGLLAVGCACVTPYGWDAILAARRILNLGQALALIGEWRPADFSHPGTLEITLLGGIALMLWRGFTLSPLRIVLLCGLMFMALRAVRNAEVLALLAPMLLARPLAAQSGAEPPSRAPSRPRPVTALFFAAALTAALLPLRPYSPSEFAAPRAAVEVLKAQGLARVLNDYDFGGYLIAQGVTPYIDGRTELYGEARMVAHNNFSGAQNPDDFFSIIADPRIEATLLRPESAATRLLDHLDGWRRIYADELAVIHRRDSAASASVTPRLRSSLD